MNQKHLGVLLVITFNILSGIHAVYLSGLLRDVEVFSVIFVCFSFVSLVFLFFDNFERKLIVYKKEHVFYLILINLCTVGNWISFFIALKFIEPAISSALANSVSPLFTLCMVSIFSLSKNITKNQIIVSLGIFISMVLMIFITLSGKTATSNIEYNYLLWGVLASLVCGISMALTTIVSKKLYTLGISAKKVMKFRFLLLITISAFLAGKDNISYVISNYLYILILVSTLGSVIPLFILQLSIEKLEPITISMLLVLAPIFYLIIQAFDKNISFSLYSLVMISISIIFVLIGTRLNLKKEG